MSDPNDTMADSGETPVANAIRAKLRAGFAPIALEVIDESKKHAGHAHVVARPGVAGGVGETHFKVKLISAAFAGMSRVDRHRAVNAALAQEIEAGVHALSIDAKAPGE
jgi:BolA protein